MSIRMLIILVSCFALKSLSAPVKESNGMCREYLGKADNEAFQYTFVRTGEAGSYNIVEVPTSANSDKYITVYTANGYAEVNSETGACNMKKTEKAANRDKKIVEMYKKIDDREKQVKRDYENKQKKILDSGNEQDIFAYSWLALVSNFLEDDLKRIKRNCADNFPVLAEYMEKNGGIPSPTPNYVDPVPPCPATGCPQMPSAIIR